MLVPVTEADGVLLDLRYATSNNVAGRPIYRRPVALLRPEARIALLAASVRARVMGLRLRLYDAFRPLEAQWVLWHAIEDKAYVADPRGGGTHPRGIAVDLTLADGATGAELAMGTGFDDCTSLSGHGAVKGLEPAEVRNRALLLGIMTASGWDHYAAEWWHYQLPGHGLLPALDSADVADGPM